jgi:hypothetical protein
MFCFQAIVHVSGLNSLGAAPQDVVDGCFIACRVWSSNEEKAKLKAITKVSKNPKILNLTNTLTDGITYEVDEIFKLSIFNFITQRKPRGVIFYSEEE